jgi:periplasmic protein TonB
MYSRPTAALAERPSVILLALRAPPSLKEMALRCLLFCSEEETVAPIRQVLTSLSVEGDYRSEAVSAVEQIIHQPLQIVIIDWDKQPEASLLLTTARERKAAERPLTLAIVSNDASVPKALQAGANSILRKPIMINQVADTLKTACDLLRAKQESVAAQAAAAALGPSTPPVFVEQGGEGHLRAGEFLQSGAPAPSSQFLVESDTQKALQQPATEELDPLKELEPMAAAVQAEPTPPAPPPADDEPRGLSWYMNQRAGKLPVVPQMSGAAAAPAPAPASPELLGYDQMRSESEPSAASSETAADAAPEAIPEPAPASEQKAEAQLFAYITGEEQKSEAKPEARLPLRKKAVIGAVVLAGCAIAAAPQAPWHPKMQAVWARAQKATHAWLNPQPVTTPQAPTAHEDFARAGDEYKLPVAENIPDATTDPSQIRVTPVVDPTAKKPADAETGTEQPPAVGEGTATSPADQTQTPVVQVQENPSAQPAAEGTPSTAEPAGGTAAPNSPEAAAARLRADAIAAASAPPPTLVAPTSAAPTPPVSPLPHSVSAPTAPAGIPSSLKSQMASMAPDASGNKPVEAALPSIEPVDIPEAAARDLLTDQPAPAYPESAKGQEGTVVLQVLIGRDGTVKDAKFLQGSLAFARTAIDGVKLWKFKPYTMNNRAVSVQTNLTLSFKAAP